MVERNVKLMSVQASPSVKKMTSVLAIALGCDQKNASIHPVRAAISQSPMMPTRMPTWVATIAQVGQSRLHRQAARRLRAAGLARLPAAAASRRGRREFRRWRVLNGHRSLLMRQAAWSSVRMPCGSR